MADCSPTTIDGTPEESAVECSRCERRFSPANICACSFCKSELCADCLGPDPLGFCVTCVGVARMPARHSVLIIATALVPRELRMQHVRINRVGGQHAEVITEDGATRAIVPVGVLAGAADQIAALRAKVA